MFFEILKTTNKLEKYSGNHNSLSESCNCDLQKVNGDRSLSANRLFKSPFLERKFSLSAKRGCWKKLFRATKSEFIAIMKH
jgi:hypothetical protein